MKHSKVLLSTAILLLFSFAFTGTDAQIKREQVFGGNGPDILYDMIPGPDVDGDGTSKGNGYMLVGTNSYDASNNALAIYTDDSFTEIAHVEFGGAGNGQMRFAGGNAAYYWEKGATAFKFVVVSDVAGACGTGNSQKYTILTIDMGSAAKLSAETFDPCLQIYNTTLASALRLESGEILVLATQGGATGSTGPLYDYMLARINNNFTSKTEYNPYRAKGTKHFPQDMLYTETSSGIVVTLVESGFWTTSYPSDVKIASVTKDLLKADEWYQFTGTADICDRWTFQGALNSIIEVGSDYYAAGYLYNYEDCTKGSTIHDYDLKDQDFYVTGVSTTSASMPYFRWGGTLNDRATDLVQVSGGGFAIVGITESPLSGHHGNHDILLVKLSTTLDSPVPLCIGGAGNEGYKCDKGSGSCEFLRTIVCKSNSSEDDIIIASSTNSFGEDRGDVNSAGETSTDYNFWLVEIGPPNPEICDCKDNDLDGEIDEGFGKNYWYVDADGDGDGNPSNSKATSICCPSPGRFYVKNSYDCDDADASINSKALIISSEDAYLCSGESATITALCRIDGAMYQWYKESVAITGKISSSSIVVSNPGKFHGTYHAEITLTDGTVITTETVKIYNTNIDPGLTIVKKAAGGSSIRLSVSTYVPDGTYNYQWYFNPSVGTDCEILKRIIPDFSGKSITVSKSGVYVLLVDNGNCCRSLKVRVF